MDDYGGKVHPELGGPFSKKMLLEINNSRNQNDRHMIGTKFTAVTSLICKIGFEKQNKETTIDFKF